VIIVKLDANHSSGFPGPWPRDRRSQAGGKADRACMSKTASRKRRQRDVAFPHDGLGRETVKLEYRRPGTAFPSAVPLHPVAIEIGAGGGRYRAGGAQRAMPARIASRSG
jgi:hypothetical protein